MKDSIRVEFEMEQMMCTTCKKSSSEYYELKVQARFKHYNDIESIRDEVKEYLVSNFKGINKTEDLDSGFDLYFGNKGAMNKISTILNKRYFIDEVRTKKIVGHNFLESKDIWRHTLLVNFVNIKVKDKVSIKGEDYYIKAFNNKTIVLRSLVDGSKKVVNYSIIKEYLKILE